MIFTPPRFIVLDDTKEHLTAITDAFQKLGSPCLGVHFEASKTLDKNLFQGVRALFIDLHLLGGQASTDQRQNYGIICGILEENINPNGGPYILVLWTEYPDYCEKLKEYIERIESHAKPLAVISLSKIEFINTQDGMTNNPEKLRTSVRSAVYSNPQLAAMLEWEAGVLNAASATLCSLLNLIPNEDKNGNSYSDKIDILLSRLAQEAVGQNNIPNDHRAAVNNALSPILFDRIMNQKKTEGTDDLWSQAITKYNERLSCATQEEAGLINKMLHFADPEYENIRPTDWGAVVNWPFGNQPDDIEKILGMPLKSFICNELKMRSSAITDCKLLLIRVGAVCDHAQNNSGRITYLIAVEVPTSAERCLDRNGNEIKVSDSIWKSPVYKPNGSDVISNIYVHIRFPITTTKDECDGWSAIYRVREQLLMNLLSTSSNYMSRPGILQLPVY
ncbi:hypothetical protein V1234_02785 [Serratia marcescens]|uniref:hypothetical protein n=1 Tax=Serratia marcescens TaxID=615 RepID=UPI001DA8C99C|nr:hypothetical protein [Serratia marcescens]MBN5185529.1 hypothetical protein [Serratia marcescens]MBN5193489.1 hypothetical protein [Serratia marcescens]WVJ42472.1 hypothetical protein V1234_02785 [Serratia marcescens]BEO26272.1 hypothetical protein SMQC20_48560 [Serratia marcescens]